MDSVLYLIHSTNKYNENWNELKVSELNNSQFPGVYFTLITKDNIDTEPIHHFGKYNLIFSKRLLEQKNFHINLSDHNGFISESNSYFNWELDKVVKKIKHYSSRKNLNLVGNEVVFHDPISIDYLCCIFKKEKKSVDDFNYKRNKYLPHYPIENDIMPDLTKKPFYCFPFEKNYSGIKNTPFIKNSSKKFFITIAKACGIEGEGGLEGGVEGEDKSIKEIINNINTRLPELYKNRDLIKIEYFKDFIRNHGWIF